MPIYEYHCSQCGENFDYLHKRLNEPAPNCPKCGSSEVKKRFSTFAATVAPAGCAHQDTCPAAGGHHCCPGCCHHH